jgi:murein DD-endopeptidase MepM/ murein hydrolase activator NlpD
VVTPLIPRDKSRLLFLTFTFLGSGLFLSACTHSHVNNPLRATSPNLEAIEGQKMENAQSDLRPFIDWPVDRARLTRGFFTNRRRPHLGIDLAGPRGTPVLSAHHGVVIYAGRDFRGFGKMLIIEGENGWASLYAHLDQILVQEGQQVRQGSTIAKMGNTGRSTGPHLHFELRKDKLPVDPLVYLPGGTEASRKLANEK